MRHRLTSINYFTNKNGTVSHEANGKFSIDYWGNEKIYNNTSFTTSETNDGTLRKVSLRFRKGGLESLTGYNNGIVGLMDLREVNSYDGVAFHTNPLMTEILFHPFQGSITTFSLYQTGLINLDISMLTGLSASVYLYLNPDLVNINFPNSSNTITALYIAFCNILPSIDLSGLTGLSGELQFHTNPLLTNIIHPATLNTIPFYFAHGCNLGYIDFTPMSNMTNVNNCIIQLQNNAMTTAEVNHILADLDSISVGGYTGRTINIAGTNSAPDGSSGGYNGTAAVASLVSKGFTVTHT